MIIDLIIILIIFNLLKLHSNSNEHEFSYSGSTGPEKWSKLTSDYKTCSDKAQSPINIDTKTIKSQKIIWKLIFKKNSKFMIMDMQLFLMMCTSKVI